MSYDTKNYKKQGGEEWVIGGKLTIASGGSIQTADGVGTANAGVTAVEYGSGVNHKTVLTVNQAAALTLGDNASLADGYLLYTFPAGALVVNSASMSMGVTNAEHAAENPDVGLGVLI